VAGSRALLGEALWADVVCPSGAGRFQARSGAARVLVFARRDRRPAQGSPGSRQEPPGRSVPGALRAVFQGSAEVVTESQNGQGWKGPLWVTQSNPPAEAGSPTVGCRGPCSSVMFSLNLMSDYQEVLHPLLSTDLNLKNPQNPGKFGLKFCPLADKGQFGVLSGRISPLVSGPGLAALCSSAP